MWFNNKSKKYSHLVHANLMREFFNGQLSELEVNLLNNHAVIVDEFPSFLSSATPTKVDKLKGLLCYFLGQDDTLEEMPRAILDSVSPKLIARAALLTGRFCVIRALNIAESSFKEILKDPRIADSLRSILTRIDFDKDPRIADSLGSILTTIDFDNGHSNSVDSCRAPNIAESSLKEILKDPRIADSLRSILTRIDFDTRHSNSVDSCRAPRIFTSRLTQHKPTPLIKKPS